MNEIFGISGGSKRAEDLFVRITGAARSRASNGGAIIISGSPVEVRWTSTNTINQVRAAKYLTLVIRHVDGSWYVVPPNIIVELMSFKGRGQHGENPFESATLNLNQLRQYRVDEESQLTAATLAAISEGLRHPELEEAMRDILRESRGLAARSIETIRTILER